MNKSLISKILFSSLGGHAAAILFLALSSAVLMNFRSTEGIPLYFGFIGIGIGTLVCALLARKNGIGLGGAFVSGLLYSAVLALLSLIAGKESEISIGARLGVFLMAAIIIGLVSLIPASSNKNTRSAVKKRRSALSKYMDKR